MALGANILAGATSPLVHRVANADDIGLGAPEPRLGEGLRTWVRSLSVFQKEALVRSAFTGETWRLASDEGPYLDGHDEAPCPLAFFTVGMAASFAGEIIALAGARNAGLTRLRLTQDNYYSMKGSMIRRTMEGGALPVEIEAAIECDLDDDSARGLIADALAAAPIHGLMRAPVPSLFALARNASQLTTGKAKPIESGALLAIPDDGFERVAVGEPAEPIITKIGLTPRKEVEGGTATAGSSLADEQNRVLNVGAVCELREDGVKEITQLLYSPHGTSFRFLSDEAPAAGGTGRAPDAATYLSAGIGFCFMTQFGRFAKMTGKDLSDYRIVQDSHFSQGGASGGTGRPGMADPLETHCHLTTSESDDDAREMLDMAEKTCFLHALCRGEVKTKLKVTRL